LWRFKSQNATRTPHATAGAFSSSIAQRVAVCFGVCQCVTACFSVFQCVSVCFSVLQCRHVAVCCGVLQYVAVCCSALQHSTLSESVCDADILCRRGYRVAKNHRMPEVAGHFPQKSHQFQGSFAENDL